jgi:hypothetical protein
MDQETTTLTERVAALEREVAFLKMRLIQLTTPADWLDRISGSMKDEPAFAEAMRMAAEIRRSDRPSDDDL